MSLYTGGNGAYLRGTPHRMTARTTSLGSLDELPPAPEWKWISVYQDGTETTAATISHQKHETWMEQHQEAHSVPEVLICLSGDHFYGFGGKLWRMTPGTVLLISKGVPHDAVYSPYQTPCRDLWLHLRSPHFLSVNDVCVGRKNGEMEIQQCFYLVPNARSFTSGACLAWSRLEQDPHNPFRFYQLQSAITSLLMETMLYAAQPSASPQRIAHQQIAVDEIKHFIEANLAKKLSLEDLADMAGYEAVYFHRLFSRYAGEPVHQFVNRKRLERAQELLKEGYKIVSIAGALGFASSSYFCRFFKRETNDTPSVWLEKSKVQVGK